MRALPFVSLFFATICAGQSTQISPSTIYERSYSSVVVVVVLDKKLNPTSQGSGFVVDRDRVVTNHHVIEGAASAVIVFADGKTEHAEGIAADSAARDLAILAVKTGTRPPLKLGNELAVKQGDSVYAIGAPRGLELSITNGIVSGFRDVDNQFLLQTTAAIAPGSSGGPLLDSSGRVVGVTTALLSDSPGIYFSVGAGDVSRMIRTPGIIIPFSTPISTKPPPRSEPSGIPSPIATNETRILLKSQPPGADIFINGRKQPGQTPTTLPLSPGDYNLVLRLKGYASYSGQIRVQENTETSVNIELKEKENQPAWVQVNSDPLGAEIFVDGDSTGQFTQARVLIQPGLHTVELRRDGYQIAKRTIQASEGGTVTLTVKLTQK